ncbi:hypothetical protein C8Q80DRAFT_306857 [Daedaleopsis nitida]|nr:hypothetical protein C8Q80DRAFT_306857 [Daedaleopsis nitida]
MAALVVDDSDPGFNFPASSWSSAQSKLAVGGTTHHPLAGSTVSSGSATLSFTGTGFEVVVFAAQALDTDAIVVACEVDDRFYLILPNGVPSSYPANVTWCTTSDLQMGEHKLTLEINGGDHADEFQLDFVRVLGASSTTPIPTPTTSTTSSSSSSSSSSESPTTSLTTSATTPSATAATESAVTADTTATPTLIPSSGASATTSSTGPSQSESASTLSITPGSGSGGTETQTGTQTVSPANVSSARNVNLAGVIGGAVSGGVVLGILSFVLAFCLLRRRRTARGRSGSNSVSDLDEEQKIQSSPQLTSEASTSALSSPDRSRSDSLAEVIHIAAPPGGHTHALTSLPPPLPPPSVPLNVAVASSEGGSGTGAGPVRSSASARPLHARAASAVPAEEAAQDAAMLDATDLARHRRRLERGQSKSRVAAADGTAVQPLHPVAHAQPEPVVTVAVTQAEDSGWRLRPDGEMAVEEVMLPPPYTER